MKKIAIVLLLLLVRFAPVRAEEGIIFFKGSFPEALAKAKLENKLLFIDCFTTWCGPCKWMASHVFTDKLVSEPFSKDFICFALDMEKGEGVAFAKQYLIKNYPTFLWLDGAGKQIHRSVGSAEASAFLKIGKQASDPKENLAFLKTEYESGNRNSEMLLSYAHSLKAAYDMSYQTVADQYFRSQPVAELSGEASWKTILEFTPNINSYVYDAITKSPDSFYARYGKDSVRHVLDKLTLESLSFARQQNDSDMLKKSITLLKMSSDATVVRQGAKGELDYYKGNKNYSRYAALAHEYVDRYFMDDAKILNEVCWTYFMHVNEKDGLLDAEKWIAKSVSLDDQYYNTDTYANILHKMGKKKEAIAMTNHSIDLAKKSGDDYASTQELLDELMKGK